MDGVDSACWSRVDGANFQGQSDSAETLANSRGGTEVLREYLVLVERQVDHVDTGLI
jgi:hypothetical protein